jgi:hypothetical protein
LLKPGGDFMAFFVARVGDNDEMVGTDAEPLGLVGGEGSFGEAEYGEGKDWKLNSPE